MFGLRLRRFLTLIILIAISASLVGCFMPWGYASWWLIVGANSTTMGIQSVMGVFSLFASLITLVFAVIFLLKPRTLTGLLVLFGSLAIFCFTSIWIASPSMRGVEAWTHSGPITIATYSIIYGTYVTFVSSIVSFFVSVLQIVIIRSKSSLNKTILPQTSDADLPS